MAWRDCSTKTALGAAAVTGVLALAVWVHKKLRSAGPSGAPDTVKAGNPEDEIVLIGFPRFPDVVSSLSPFVAKVETWLRFVKLPYSKQNGSPQGAPKGQLPIIQHGPNAVADSSFIIRYLQRTYPGAGRELSDKEEAISIIVHHYIEKHLLPGLFWHRWVHPQGWAGAGKYLFADTPQPLRWALLELVVRPSIQASLFYQGIWRHSEADILEVMDEGLAALAALLSDQKYLLGNAPCVADAAAFALLDNLLYDQDWAAPGMRELAQQYGSLVEYTDRIRATYYARELAWEETQM